jgi:hypothetical protein
MKRILAISGIVFLALAARAQSPGGQNNLSDSTHRHAYRNQWQRRDGENFRHGQDGYNRDRNMAYNHRRGTRRFHSHRGPRIHYTPAQRKQMMAINADYKKKSEDLFKMDNITLREYKSRLLVLQKDKKDKLQGLLTTEQKDQVAKWKKQSAENSQVRSAARLERMKIQLNLSSDQVATIQSKQENFRTQVKSIRDNDGLLPQEKMEQIKALALNQKDAIKSVLTPEQVSTFENMHRKAMEDR